MIPPPRDLYARLYSVSRFTSKIVQSCINGEAVVILLPSWLGETDAWEIVKTAFKSRDLEPAEIQIDFAQKPPRFLHEKVLGPSPQDPEEALDALVDAEEWPADKRIIYLKNVSGRPDRAPAWYDAVHELTRRLAQKESSTPKGLILFNSLDRDNPLPPQTDLPFRVYWWFGMPSTLDFQLLCRQVLDKEEELDAVTRRWLERVIPIVAAGDYRQIGPIVEAVKTDNDSLHSCLNQIAVERHWTAKSLKEAGAQQFVLQPANFAWIESPDEPPPNVRLWAQGALYATPEEGVRLHAAAVRLFGEQDAQRDPEQRNFRLNHMIWQPQNALCYGLLNEARLILNESITAAESADWPFRIEPMRMDLDELKKNALGCEIGHLRRLLDDNKLGTCGAALRESVGQLNDVRKRLAHYQPLTLEQLKEFAAVIQRLPEQLPVQEELPNSAAMTAQA